MERLLRRRDMLQATLAAGGLVACNNSPSAGSSARPAAPEDAIVSVEPLPRMHWPTRDPFLFCAHHHDRYPAGNEQLGPASSLDGRRIGSDFGGKDGWSMYHGRRVPGFPQHPHRGFETVSLVRQGLVDHADSLGATARYGQGDVQWMTAGRGIVHAEMFPLLQQGDSNPLEMFQVWLNLPATHKMVEPHFKMLWNSSIPRHAALDAEGNKTVVTVVAGRLGEVRAVAPPPKSWAAEGDSDVAIWTLAMDPAARFVLPAARRGTDRTLYFFRGASLQVGGRALREASAIVLRPETEVALTAGSEPVELLLLQGKPIGEPVARRGPFVMNSEAEIRQAYADYQRTRFGGWPWPAHDPVHPREAGRFARHVDGRIDKAT